MFEFFSLISFTWSFIFFTFAFARCERALTIPHHTNAVSTGPFTCGPPDLTLNQWYYLPSATKLRRWSFYRCVCAQGGGGGGIPACLAAGLQRGGIPPASRLLQTVCILLECILVTAHKRSLGQGNIFAPVILFTRGGRYTPRPWRYGQQAGSTHPAGMHSCYEFSFW